MVLVITTYRSGGRYYLGSLTYPAPDIHNKANPINASHSPTFVALTVSVHPANTAIIRKIQKIIANRNRILAAVIFSLLLSFLFM
jgi:hypothetical protein